MKNFIKNTLILTIIATATLSAQAQKFGYVNTQALIQDIPDVKEANANIETYKAQLQKKGQDMVKALQEKYVGLQKKQESGEISPKQLEVEAQELKKEEMKIAQFEQDGQKKMLEKSEALLKPLREKIQTAISEVAAENGYDYIFDYSMGIILYADPGTDVSALVKAKLGL